MIFKEERVPLRDPHPVIEKKDLSVLAEKKRNRYESIKKRFPKYYNLIVDISRKNGVSPFITAAIIEHESRGKVNARGSKGDASLMQVMPYHFKKGENPYDPKTNIEKGVSILKKCLENEGMDSPRALSCYNAGPNRKNRQIVSYEKNVISKLKTFLSQKKISNFQKD